MLTTNIVGNRIDGYIYINDTNIATITGYVSETKNANSSVAIVIFDNKAYYDNFNEVINDINKFINEKYKIEQENRFKYMKFDEQTSELNIQPIIEMR